jgi:hypothetical protein
MRDFGGMVSKSNTSSRCARRRGFARGDTRRELKSRFSARQRARAGLGRPFRDVFEADGRQIRDRQDRLASLFLSGTTTGAIEQARRIMDEGRDTTSGRVAEYQRADPGADVSRPDTARRVHFVDKGVRTMRRSIEFDEVRRPTVISTTGAATCRHAAVSGWTRRPAPSPALNCTPMTPEWRARSRLVRTRVDAEKPVAAQADGRSVQAPGRHVGSARCRTVFAIPRVPGQHESRSSRRPTARESRKMNTCRRFWP